ncbi:MAG: hypothetical protein K2G87_10175, partial [Oscillospiraceae bacterium]|nr:hypothetical protein [Oscillospiraceae bacterium]
VLALTACLSACSSGNAEVTETSGETVSAASETTSAESKAETVAAEDQPDTFSICGNSYSSDDTYIKIDGDALTEKGTENIRRLKNLSAVSIENPNVPLVEMFAEEPSVTKIEFVDFDGDISEYTDVLKSFKFICIETLNYSEAEMDMLMKELSEASIEYRKSVVIDIPSEGVVFYVNPIVSAYDIEARYGWIDPKSITAYFTNYTDEPQRAEKAEIFYRGAEETEPVEFTNGKTYLETDLTIEANGRLEFVIDGSMFDIENAKTGIYSVRFTFENYATEQEFFISNSDGSEFLTEEQHELLNEAHDFSTKYFSWYGYYVGSWRSDHEPHISDEASETLSRYFTQGYISAHAESVSLDDNGDLYDRSEDGGGSVVYLGHYFSPVYSDSGQVIFKSVTVNFHGDNPYFIWYDDVSLRMVKTEDGWRFDDFQFWN